MARIREEITMIENVGAGKRCIIRPAVGRTWLDVHVEHSNHTLAQILDIKVELVSPTRTVTIAEYKDGTELNELNKRYGRKVTAGTLSFYFRRPELESEAQRMATALGTGGLQSFRISYKIDAAATSPDVAAWGRKTANRHVSQNLYTYVVNHEKGGAVAGNNYMDSIDLRDRIAAVHVLNDSVDELELRVDDATAYKLTRARGEFEEGLAGRTPYDAARGMCIDFLLAGVLDESLVMQDRSSGYQAKEMRLTSTLSSAPASSIRYLVEYISSWADLNGAGARLAA